MGSPIEIVPRAETDIGQLFVLARDAFAAQPGWDEARTLAALRRDVVFVARERRVPAGYVALRREGGRSIVVEQLFVAPGHERRGVGRHLLAYAEGYAIAEHASALHIVVERDNTQARSFYVRAGFVAVAPELFELILPGA